jgi:hypothetical protein
MSTLLEQASLVMIPSGYKEDVVYSAVPTDGSGDLSFTRASNGTRVNSAGLVEVTPWNLAENSNSFGGLSLITKTTGQISPIDSTSGNLLTATGSGEHYSGTASLTVVVGNSYTYSVYGKFVQGINLALRTVFANGNEDISTIWNLSTGALLQNATAHTNPTITAVGNGYYRCSITFTPTSVPAFPLLFRLQMAVGTYLSFTASSGDGFLAYGAQINNGALAPYFPTTDRLNVPRLTYQNGGGGCPSLLLEKQSTNLQIYSEQIDLWSTTSDLSVTANNTTSPDGTQNADKLNENSSNGYHIVGDSNVTLLPSTLYTMSFFAKASERTFARILAPAGYFSTESAYFNLANGACSASGGTVSMQSMGNGWYRCVYSLTTLSSVSGGIGMWIGPARNMTDAYNTYTGTSGSGIFAYGAQIEQSSYATSLINTTSASATRVADECSKTSISSLIGQTEGVLFVDLMFTAYDNQAKWIAFLGGGGNYIGLYSGGGSNFVAEVENSGSQFINSSFTFSVGQRYKLALAYKANDFAFYVNGTQIGTDATGSVPTVSVFNFNYNTTNTALGGKVYNQVILFPTRLTNAELASLTTL